MRKFSSLFLFWVTGLALFVSITGILAKLDLSARFFQILFTPVTLYLCVNSITHVLNGSPFLDRKNGWMRILLYYSFIVTTTVVVVSFLSSNTLPEIISSLVFSPLAIYFLLMVLPQPLPAIDLSITPKSDIKQDYPKDTLMPSPKLDVNRRDFLKLIGSAGVLAFIFSLFTKKAAIPFFANISEMGTVAVKNLSGSKIDPAEKSPTDGYYISEVDDATSISYFGFINKGSQWYIMRQDIDGAFRYARGDSSFSASWANRENLNYDRFDNVFTRMNE